jgi:hypothetical protein
MNDRHLKKDPLAAANHIHYSSSDTDSSASKTQADLSSFFFIDT